MTCKVLSIPPFDRRLKRLVKNYPSLKSEVSSLITSLEESPTQGTSLGNHCYKIRLAIASKGRGKSGGARVITHVHQEDACVYLLALYDKSEISDITDRELKDLLALIE